MGSLVAAKLMSVFSLAMYPKWLAQYLTYSRYLISSFEWIIVKKQKICSYILKNAHDEKVVQSE